jgi:hypothetical protein
MAGSEWWIGISRYANHIRLLAYSPSVKPRKIEVRLCSKLQDMEKVVNLGLK